MGKSNDTTVIFNAIKAINDDKFTNEILSHLGELCAITIDAQMCVTFDLPESTSDLVVYDTDTEEWAPVVGAFTDDDHLYLIVTARSGLYIFSPTAPHDKIVNYLDTEHFQSDEYYVNHLLETNIAVISPI